jgi:GT2 family glycosyltransferase
VVLTMGDRPEALERALRSALAQTVPMDVLVLANGCGPVAVPAGVRMELLPENLGIPGGRNEGVRRTDADLLVFLDDDGYYPEPDAVASVVRAFEAEPRLGIVSLKVVDSEGGAGQRRHVPRLRAGDPDRSSEVTTFLGGAAAIRRAVFDTCGAYPDAFFFGHEESDLAWRALDAGFTIRYLGDVAMAHASRPPARSGDGLRLNARNRVWLVRRRLPWPLAGLHLLVWTALTAARLRSPKAMRGYLGGLVEGWREPAGERRPIRWSTAWRMTRLGRPPLI